MKNNAFTTIELIMVIVVMAILSVSFFASIRFFSDAELETAAAKVSADLRYARDLAVSQNQWRGVAFNLDPINTYEVFYSFATGEAVIADPANLNINLLVNVNTKYGCSIQSVNLGGSNKVLFNAFGSPYDSYKGNALASEGTIVLSKGGRSKTIYVTPETGRVRVE